MAATADAALIVPDNLSALASRLREDKAGDWGLMQ